ncbi:MAG: outer membrane protein assembly factor BamC [Pseudomonadota bacterium]
MSVNPNQPTRRIRLTAAIAILPLAGGCGLFPDRSLDYREAQLGEPLEIPEGLSDKSLDSEYVIPVVRGDTSVEQDGDFEIPRPPDLTGQIMENNYQVSRSGDLSWLIVNDVPGRVWPAISEFLGDRGAEVVHADPRAGVQQTAVLNRSGRTRDWVDVDGMDEERPLVLQVRVAHGVQSRSTEVQARLVEVEDTPEERLDWQESVDYPEREQQLLQDLADYLQANAETKTYSRVALDLPREERVTRQRSDGETQALTLSLAFNRSWAEVDQALGSMDLTVEDRDRSKGTWYLDLRTEEQRSRGWWFWQYQAESELNAELRLQESADGYELTLEPREELEQTDRVQDVLNSLYETLR